MTSVSVAAQQKTKATCLIVEDSDFDQVRIVRMLKMSGGFEPVIAGTMVAARAYLRRQTFNLLLLDNALPDGRGIDLAFELRDDPRHQNTPIIMVSDWPTPFIYEKASAARISMVLKKDEFRPRHITEALKFARIKQASRH